MKGKRFGGNRREAYPEMAETHSKRTSRARKNGEYKLGCPEVKERGGRRDAKMTPAIKRLRSSAGKEKGERGTLSELLQMPT